MNEEPAQHELNEITRKTNEIIGKAANDVLGRVTARPSKSWFDEECENTVLNKKDLRMKLMVRNTRFSSAALKKENVNIPIAKT